MTWTTLALVAAGLQISAAAQPASSVDLTFVSGSIRLAATITMPPGHGPRPGVVLVGGSGPASRQMSRVYADHFNALGFATLTYDKRGVGESEGTWTAASLEDLADDAAAAIAALASRPDVDPARVGVWGHSQGGWVVPLLAARKPRPAFAVVLSGGGAPPRDVEFAGYHAALAHAGASPSDVKEAGALLEQYFSWLGSGNGRAALELAIASAKSRSWYKALSLERVLPSQTGRVKWEWVATHDPVPYIAKIDFPTLVVLGGLDLLAPAEPAARAWQTGFERSGYGNFKIEIVADMNHSGMVGEHSPDAPISAKYLGILKQWLDQRVPQDAFQPAHLNRSTNPQISKSPKSPNLQIHKSPSLQISKSPSFYCFLWCRLNAAPCGSMQLMIQSPPGTSIGPLST